MKRSSVCSFPAHQSCLLKFSACHKGSFANLKTRRARMLSEGMPRLVAGDRHRLGMSRQIFCKLSYIIKIKLSGLKSSLHLNERVVNTLTTTSRGNPKKNISLETKEQKAFERKTSLITYVEPGLWLT